jgi:hypothetical protein
MPDDSPSIETEIIHAAYADKVKDAFMVFAENLTVGQGEKSCKDRFLRSLLLAKRARDLAFEVIGGEVPDEPPAPSESVAESGEPKSAANGDERVTGQLSAQDRAMIDAAVGGTTGVGAPPASGGPLRLR